MKTETVVGLFVLGAIGIFFYLSVSIGSFRLDRDRYDFYKAYFDDTGGLEVKDPVKIAGVDVGWVSKIELSDTGKALVVLRIRKENQLAKNAYAMVRQEGLIGNKFLEVEPGDSSTGILTPGSALGLPSQAPPTVGELLKKFGDIASNIKAVSISLKSALASPEGEENMKRTIDGFAKASERTAEFSGVLARSLKKNENNIDVAIVNVKDAAESASKAMPSIGDAARQLNDSTLPGVKSVTVALADSTLPEFTKDFKHVSKKTASAMENVEDAAVAAREGFKETEQVMEKVNKGKGLVGKLVNEDETYTDFKKTIRNFKDYTTKAQKLDLIVDVHSEVAVKDWNNKGYFELKVRPTEDYFYTVQLVSDERGKFTRKVKLNARFDSVGNKITTTGDFFPDKIETVEQEKYAVLFGLQFGKRFDRTVFRMGLFESTFGVGVDYYVPLKTDSFHWITTVEAYDFSGINRFEDTRPHIKWLNKLFFMRNFYTVFGVDDLVSKSNSSPFFGAGIRFGDKDLKLLLPSLPVGNIASSPS